MATAYLRPSATGTYDTWTLGAGASKAAATDPGGDLVHDDDTSYVYVGTSPGIGNTHQSFYLNTGIPYGLMLDITSVAMNSRSRTTGTPGSESWYHLLRLGATEGSPDSQTTTNSYANLTTSSYSRPGGGSWAVSDITDNNIQGVVYVPDDNAEVCRCTSIWVTLDYLALGGGFAYLIGELAAGALWVASSLSAREWTALRASLRHRAEFTDEEWARAQRELRECRHPRHIDMLTREAYAVAK